MPTRASKNAASYALDRQISAFINGVHLGQVLLNEKAVAKGDPKLFTRGKLSIEAVTQLCVAFQELLTVPPLGKPSNVARLNQYAQPSSPRLPVNALTAYLEKRLGKNETPSIRAFANLCQICLEVGKDGTLLQDLFRIYIAHGLKVSLTQLGLPSSDADLLAMGKELATLTGKCPFDTSAGAWQITLRKIENWGEKNSGSRDKLTLARELAATPEVKRLLPALAKLPPKRLGILGHSMTMSAHWSSAGSWCETAAEVVRLVNPKWEYRSFQEGSFTPSRAVVSKLPTLLDYRPTEAIVLLLVYTPEDRVGLEVILRKLRDIGCKPMVVDDVRPWFGEAEYPRLADVQKFQRETCKKFGAQHLGFMERGRKVRGHKNWVCLDQVHMITEGHLFYAKELLKVWAKDSSLRSE